MCSVLRHNVAPRIGNDAVRIWPYAGKPEYPALLRTSDKDVPSHNVTGAENQQERLIERRKWMIGFVDGEGCFSTRLARALSGCGKQAMRPDSRRSSELFADDGLEQIHRRAHQNPQRPYARCPRHRVMRWSHLHGDMQGVAS
jgi:hypothetical protein